MVNMRPRLSEGMRKILQWFIFSYIYRPKEPLTLEEVEQIHPIFLNDEVKDIILRLRGEKKGGRRREIGKRGRPLISKPTQEGLRKRRYREQKRG